MMSRGKAQDGLRTSQTEVLLYGSGHGASASLASTACHQPRAASAPRRLSLDMRLSTARSMMHLQSDRVANIGALERRQRVCHGPCHAGGECWPADTAGAQ